MTDFERKVAETITRYRLAEPGMRIGVALSGGADSVALLAAMTALGYDTTALNCNFALRGAESDRDTAFARETARRLGCRFLTVAFDTRARAEQTGESLEMACRELRYRWFAETAAVERLDRVAIGHHRQDRIETFMLNALRGSGLHGLSSMRPRRGIFVRPLIGVTREEIREYLRLRGLDWVEDSSNNSDEFRRNRLRNDILPRIEAAFPGAVDRLSATIGHLESQDRLLAELVGGRMARYVDDSGGRIDVAALAASEPMARELLSEYMRRCDGGLSDNQIAGILRSASGSGLRFGGWELDRGVLSRREDGDADDGPTAATVTDLAGSPIEVTRLGRDRFSPRRDPSEAWFDASVMEGEPRWEYRPWRRGDRMRPFGMRCSRLVSDIFVDAKLSARDKRQIRLLVRDGRVVWIPGVKNSAEFPVTADTCEVILMQSINILI
ncbi:MAG: tRNA lysidine(34) synthetase TilS [Clostridium sp.]|nr:tRNA lysidine(34) synthetase TilS [Clostridium sp.]